MLASVHFWRHLVNEFKHEKTSVCRDPPNKSTCRDRWHTTPTRSWHYGCFPRSPPECRIGHCSPRQATERDSKHGRRTLERSGEGRLGNDCPTVCMSFPNDGNTEKVISTTRLCNKLTPEHGYMWLGDIKPVYW